MAARLSCLSSASRPRRLAGGGRSAQTLGRSNHPMHSLRVTLLEVPMHVARCFKGLMSIDPPLSVSQLVRRHRTALPSFSAAHGGGNTQACSSVLALEPARGAAVSQAVGPPPGGGTALRHRSSWRRKEAPANVWRQLLQPFALGHPNKVQPNPSLERTSTGLAPRLSCSIIRLAAKPAAAAQLKR